MRGYSSPLRAGLSSSLQANPPPGCGVSRSLLWAGTPLGLGESAGCRVRPRASVAGPCPPGSPCIPGRGGTWLLSSPPTPAGPTLPTRYPLLPCSLCGHLQLQPPAWWLADPSTGFEQAEGRGASSAAPAPQRPQRPCLSPPKSANIRKDLCP